jgi:hypothetical protein
LRKGVGVKVGVRVGVRVIVGVIVGVTVEVSVSVTTGASVAVGVFDARLVGGAYRVAVFVGRCGGRWVLVGGREVFEAMGGGGAVGVPPAYCLAATDCGQANKPSMKRLEKMITTFCIVTLLSEPC